MSSRENVFKFLGLSTCLALSGTAAAQTCGIQGNGNYVCTYSGSSTAYNFQDASGTAAPMQVTTTGNVVMNVDSGSATGLNFGSYGGGNGNGVTGLQFTNSGSVTLNPGNASNPPTYGLQATLGAGSGINGGSSYTHDATGVQGGIWLTNTGAINLNLSNFTVAQSAGIWGLEYGGDASGNSASGGDGGDGGFATRVNITNNANLTVTATGQGSLAGILAQSHGGNGITGGNSTQSGATNGNGGNAGTISVVNTAPILVNFTWADGGSANTGRFGILAESTGGDGGGTGSGGRYGSKAQGGYGGYGNLSSISLNSGDVALNVLGTGPTLPKTLANLSGAVVATSIGGAGGIGGDQQDGYDGGAGGASQGVSINITNSSVWGYGDNVPGVVALAVGGDGGTGGLFNSSDTNKAHAGGGGTGGNVVGGVSISASGPSPTGVLVSTQGVNSPGIYGAAIGGNGGSGGTYQNEFGQGTAGAGGSGGQANSNVLPNSYTVVIEASNGIISTTGANSPGMIGLTQGGQGQDGLSGQSSVDLTGGAGGNGGGAGNVSVTLGNGGSITTTGNDSIGILVQSMGGQAGNGGEGDGSVSAGGAGGIGGDTGLVQATNQGSISTTGDSARGMLAQVLGGTGGGGGQTWGLFYASGGKGAAAGGTNQAVGTNNGSIVTTGDNAEGVLLQSIGGGGGAGGSVSGPIANLGGSGALGSNAFLVTFNSTGGTIATSGTSSTGVLGQSIGGGGGDGGNASGLSITVGGSGAGGGAGGNVLANLTSNSSITTSGTSAAGIVMQSIGGGGGNGGNAYGGGTVAALSIGGSATKAGGGNAGSVEVSASNSSIVTRGGKSPGIVVQSIGGGGGMGGQAFDGTISEGFTANMAVGGSGGNGGVGGNATVNLVNTSVATGQTSLLINGTGSSTNCTGFPCNRLPADSYGVVVQSIGGGGGVGGSSVSDASAITPPTTGGPTVAIAISSSIGGKGGSGQDGGLATFGLSNGASIQTQGNGSTGVLVQSIGGGGGSGGDSTANSLAVGYGSSSLPEGTSSWAATGEFTVGGTGGSAGNGSNVLVAMGGTTLGYNDPNFSSGSPTSIADASGSNTTYITTYGDHANGITAQSIGGGGGNAGWGSGNTQSFGTKQNTSFGVNLGSAGGAGGSGGTVQVNLYSGQIQTYGSGSAGVVAQSIGGGGGTSQGGSINAQQSFSAGDQTVKPGLNLALGGLGAPGGNGGSVNVFQGASINTQGGDATGLLVQSIAGGGGLGGSAGSDGSGDNPIITLLKAREANSNSSSGSVPVDVTYVLAVGGKGGEGGNGGALSLTLAQPIGTAGDWAHGVMAQSIGGGGGKGGTSTATGTGGLPEITINLDHTIGGEGGSSGSGGSINIDFTQNGSIATSGYAAAAAVAQSVGGGGGVGADGSDQATGLLTVGAGGRPGQSGAGGDGGSVTFATSSLTSDTNAPTIKTTGDGADGVLLQSIGGGGGLGGAGSSKFQSGWAGSGQLRLILGGAINANGNGGAVTFDSTNQPVAISTAGVNAFGILAQSIGGGGGAIIAQSSSTDIVTQIGGTSNVNNANAGQVNVTLGSGSSITTNGFGAFGIAAQSIGGGGGVIRVLNSTTVAPQLDTGSSSSTAQTRPSPGVGRSVAVAVNSGASVTVNGPGAIGVFAQSVNGGGGLITNGNTMYAGAPQQSNDCNGSSCQQGLSTVGITVDGSVTANGQQSIALFAQAVGFSAGTTNITVNGTVNGSQQQIGPNGPEGNQPGPIVPAANAGGPDQTALIQMDAPGSSGLLTVSSTGRVLAKSMNGVFGNAVQSLSGASTVELRGMITGSMLLRDGAFNIRNGGVHNAGALTQAGKVVNEGTINVGVPGSTVSSTQVTTITGDYVQSAQGDLGVTVHSLNNAVGLMHVNGTAVTDGLITPTAISLLPGEIPVFSANNLQGLPAARDSLVFDWQSKRRDNQITITPNSNFRPQGVSLTDSQQSLADYHSLAWNNSDRNAAYRFADLSRINDGDDYKKALNSMSAKATQAQSVALANSAGAILGASMSCPVFVSTNTLLGEDNCAWGAVNGRWSDQSAHGETLGYHVSSNTYRFGGQHKIAPEWYLGGSVSAGQTYARMNKGSTGDGDIYDGSITLKHIAGPWQFAGSLAVASGSFDTQRQVDVGGNVQTLKGHPKVKLAGARVRVGYEIPGETWYLKPYGDVDVVYTSMPGFKESGSDSYALNVRSSHQTNVAFSPMLEFGRRMEIDEKTTVRAYAAFGAYIRPSSSYTVQSSFGSDSSGATFTDRIDTPNVLGKVDLGVQFYRLGGFEFKAGYTADFGSHFVSQTASARFAYHF